MEVRGQAKEVGSLFCYMDTKDQTQVIRLGGKLLDLLSHLMAHFMIIIVVAVNVNGGEVSHSVHVAVRRQIYGVSSLLFLCVF